MFKDEFESFDPTKLPLANAQEVKENAFPADPRDEAFKSDDVQWSKPEPVPLLKVSDSLKFSTASRQ